MKITKLQNADIKLVYFDNKFGLPHCKIHGAMNKLTEDGIWRCVTSYKRIPQEGVHQSQWKIKENNCLAGCQEIGSFKEDK